MKDQGCAVNNDRPRRLVPQAIEALLLSPSFSSESLIGGVRLAAARLITLLAGFQILAGTRHARTCFSSSASTAPPSKWPVDHHSCAHRNGCHARCLAILLRAGFIRRYETPISAGIFVSYQIFSKGFNGKRFINLWTAAVKRVLICRTIPYRAKYRNPYLRFPLRWIWKLE